MNPTRATASTATLLLALTAAGTAIAATAHRNPAPCPSGYVQREVRIEHQRLESDPRPGRSPVVVPNTWPEDNNGAVDRRYLVALTCVRHLTPAERNSEPYTDGGPPGGLTTVPAPSPGPKVTR